MKNFIFLLFFFCSINSIQAQDTCAISTISVEFRTAQNDLKLLKNVTLLHKDSTSIMIQQHSKKMEIEPISIQIQDINSLYLLKKERFTNRGVLAGILIGGLVGFVGGAIGSPSNSGSSSNNTGGFNLSGIDDLEESLNRLGLVFGGMAVGGTVGYTLKLYSVKKIEIRDLP